MKKSPFAHAKSTVHSQRLALESRLVFDGAMVATATEVQADSADNKPLSDNPSAAAPSAPPVDFFMDKTSPAVDYQATVDSTDNQPAFAVEPTQTVSPVSGVSGAYATTLIVVDPRADNAGALYSNPPVNTQVMVLDAARDGFQQVSELLQGRQDVTELNVLPWTSGNTQWLGNKALTATLEPTVSNELMHWGDGFTDNTDIIFHGSTNLGTTWLHHIDALTGADTHWVQGADFSSPSHELIVVDTRIDNYQSLLASFNASAEILFIDPSKDGIQQLVDGVKGRADISALHILSHGSQGSFTLGTSTLNSDNIDGYQAQLADIGQSLSNNGDILFYGCEVADSAAGAAFINRLAALTQADISASNDVTGNAAKGGDWVLEYNSGAIETASLVATSYDGLLAAPVNTVPAAQSIAEDNTLTFVGAGKIISIADADGTVSSVTVSVANGTLTLSGTAGLILTGNGTATVSITGGTITAINTALSGLIYNPTANYSGTDTLTIATFDGTTTDTDTVAITVTPNATAPVLTLPVTSQVVQEDVPAYLNFTAVNPIILTDADANDQQVLTLSVAHGTLLVKTNVAGGVTSATNNGTGTVILRGTAAQLSATLADSQGIQYTSALNYNSSDPAFLATPETLSFSLSDGVVAHNKSGTVAINVTPVNDAPAFTGATPALAFEGGNVAFSLAQLASSANVLDVDIQTGQQVLPQLAVKIDSLPVGGTLTYKGGAVAIGSIVPVTDLANLVFTHDGTDLIANQTISFNVTVSDGGGGSTAGSMSVTVQPKNVAPVISGIPTLIEGQVKVVAPTINLGDASDTLANSSITIDNIITGGQGTFFIDANNNNIIDAGETLSGTITLDATQRANLSTQFKFSQNGNEPNIPATISPSYRITVTDAGGATAIPSAAIAQTITLNVLPNNDDPTLLNTHASVGTALSAQEGNVTAITAAMLKISDGDRNPANLAQTTPENQLVYTVETRPTQGEIQIFVGGGLGYGLDGWITLGNGGRFTQAQVAAGEVRYYQTTNVPDAVTTPDNFTFTVRDSAYGYDVWTDPANPTSNREGGLRATPTGVIATQQFFLGITPLAAVNTPRTDVDPIGGTGNWEGAPRPATAGFGGSNMVYSFFPTGGMLSNNSTAGGSWQEANVNSPPGYVITATMLSYTITRTDTMGTPATGDDVSVTVPPNETVYTLTVQPSNGIIQSFASGSWQTVPTNAQFTQADINSGNIRFVHNGSEDHTSTFGYTVSDGTPNNYTSTFGLDITPTNDRPTAVGGMVKVNEKLLPANDGLVRLGSSALGMSDVDLSLDITKQATPEGKQDFLWFKVIAQPADAGTTQRGELQRWNGSAWVTVTLGEWLPSTLLTTMVGGATSGLRYAHDGSEPLAYPTNPNVTFQYQVRDDLLNPNNAFATNTSAVADSSGSAQSNQSALATTTIQIIPVNNAPLIADKPGDADPTVIGTITGGGVLTGVNEILTNVPEGGTVTITSALLTAIDQDNTTVQRQYILKSLPTQGNLLLNNQFLGADSTFTQDDIDNNRLTYRHNGSEFPTPTTDTLGTYSDKFHFIVSDAVFYDSGTNAPNYNTFLIDFGAVPTNDAPTIVAPSGIIDIDSATPANNLVTGFVVADPDLTNGVQAGETDFVQVTVRLLDSAGTPLTNYSTGFAGAGVNIGYTAQSGGLWAVTQTGVDSILQLQGSRAQVNAALAGLSVTFTNDANSMYKVQVIVDDRLRNAAGALDATGNDANGGELNQSVTLGGTPTAVPATIYDWATTTAVPAVPNGNIAAATVDIRASRVNETPTFTGPVSVTVLEDVRTPIPANSFVIADPESAAFNTPVTVTLSIPAGQGTLDVAAAGSTQTSFTPSGGQAITISGDRTTSITLTGRAADIQALLNQRNFANTANDTNGGLYYSALANSNHDYNAASAGDVSLTLSLVDTSSRFGSDVGAGSVAANPVDIVIPITITPVNDAPTVNRTNTTIPIVGTTAVTGFSIADVDNTDGGVLITTTGEVDFIQATIRLLPAAGTAPLPVTGGVGGVDHSNVVFSSSSVGGATVDTTYTGTGSALVIRGTMAQVNTYLSGLTVALNGGLANNNTTYRVQVIADDRLRDAAGVLDGSNAANGGLNSDGSTGTANVPVTVVDPYAAVPALALNVASNTRDILSSGVNEAPSFVALDNTPTFVENGAAIVLDANATLTDPELSVYSNWNQAVLTLARNGGANSDDVFGVTGSINFNGANIRNGSTVIGTFTNIAGTLAITFNANATNAVVNLVLQAITYSNNNNTPPANITINYTVNDGDTDADRATNGQGTGGALIGTGSINVGITAVNDAPTLSGVTAKTYTEDATPVVIGTGVTLNDPELKTFVGGTGDWGNAYLVLSRSGVADVNDVFSASGTLSALTEGSTLLDGVVTIGTVTQNTAGILTITFADGVTTAQVQTALSKIAYSNPLQSLAATATSPITLNWVLHDGDTDPDRALNGQGTTGDKSVTFAQTITLTGVNDAPVLSDTALSITQTEDAVAPVGAVGTLVSALASAGNITDADTSNPKGIAITATDSTRGIWYYSTNNGTSWTTFTATNTTARLLAADGNTRVYFQPTANWQGSITSGLTIRAWDRSTGTNGGTAIQDLSIGANVGGTTAFSSATDVVAVTVTSVNDQPTATTDVVLPAILEDTTPNGALISGLAFNYSDVTDNQTSNGGGDTSTAFSYMAIVGSTNYIATQGSWQVSTTASPNPAVAGDWITIPVSGLTTTSALIFASDRQIRFVPAADFHGTPGTLQVQLADANAILTSSATAAATFDITNPTNGGTGITGAWNNANRNISTTVTTVNDAPTLSGSTTITATNEDTTSATRTAANIAASLTYSDTTDNKSTITGGGTTESLQTALAIVGNAATAAQGTWQYTTDGSTWITIPTAISDSTAVVLNLANANHQIRFVPFADYNGAVGSLTLRAADGTWNTLTGIQDISGIIGTTNPWSTGTATLGITVNPVNDAPSIIAPTIPTPTYIEQAAPLTIGTGVVVTDLIDDTQLSGATVTIGAANLRFGDTLAATVGATGITQSYDANTGTLTLSGVANIADYNTVLQSVTFSNLISDAPTTTGGTTRIITWQATDNNADNAANGRLPSNAVTSSINITPVSDAPMGKNAIITTNEDQSYTFTTANFGFSDSRDNPANTLARVLISTLPANGTLQLNGVNVAAGDYILASDISSGKLTFVPATNFNSVTATTVSPALAITDNATITSTLTISGATGNISDLDVALNISHNGTGDLIITLTAPDGTVQTLFTNSGDFYNDLVLTFDDEAATSVTAIPNDTNNNIPDSYRPANPLSVFDGRNPNGIWTLTVTDNTTGRTGTLNSWGLIQSTTTTPALNFTFRVEDTGSIANGGVILDQSPNTMTINVIPLNDAPVLTATASNPSVTENATTASGTSVDPVALFTGASIADIDLSTTPTLTSTVFGAGSITVSFTDAYVTGDVLFVDPAILAVLPAGVTVSGGTANALTITLATTTTVAEVNNILAAISYKSTSDTPTLNDTDNSRAYQIVISDGNNSQGAVNPNAGGPTALNSNIINGTLSIASTNDAPIFTALGNTVSFTEVGSAVVLNNAVTISDVDLNPLNSGTGNYNRTTLTLARNGGANAEDVFSNSGSLAALTQGGNLTVGATIIGTVTTNSAGTLVLTFNTNATTALVNSALQQIAYRNNSATPQASVQIDWLFNDQNPNITGGGTAGTGQNQGGRGLLTASGFTTVNIDRLPTANADTNSIAENALNVTGNVMTGATTADDQGDPLTTVTGVATGTPSSTSGNVNTAIAGSYGSLTLDSTGAYIYTLDNANPLVNKLLTGQTLTETYSYTITDADGDPSTTTLIITINGVTDGAPTVVPVDGNGGAVTGEATVFEKGLVAPTDNSQTTTGTLTVTAPDGMASVTIGGTTFTVAQLATFSVGSPSVAINTGEGTLKVTGFTIGTGAASAPTTGTLSYTYTLNATQAHTGGAAVTESVDTIALVVTDATTAANTSTGTLTVRIVDDTPTANADTNSITENIATTTGNVFGAGSGGDVADRIGADVNAAPVTGVAAGTQPSTSGSVNTPVAGSYGSLTLNATGSYTYTLDNSNAAVNALRTGQTLTDTYSYTITDADGDTSTTTLTITINGVTDGAPVITPVDGNGVATGEATVFEKGLVAPTDNSQTTTGTLTVTVPDGMASVTIGGTTFTVAQLATFSVGSPSVGINTGEGTLNVTGFTVATGTASAPTAGTLSYSYTLNANQAHTGGAAVTESVDSIALIVTDATTAANTSTGTLTVRIVDDTPTANADTNIVAEGTTAAATTSSGNVFSGSAPDVADRLGADVTATPVTGIAFGTQASTSGNVGSAVAGSYGSLTLNADGSYTYTLDNTNPLVNKLLTGNTLLETYSYTITDADGDTSTTTLKITINGTTDNIPSIVPVDGNGGLITGVLTVQESGLTSGADTSETNTGTLTLSALDGLAGIKVASTPITLAQLNTLGATPITIVTPKGTITLTGYNSTANVGGVSTAGTLTYTYTLTQVQNTPAATENTDNIALSITNAGGNTVTDTLIVQIVDDIPTANADVNSVNESNSTAATTTSGNVFSGSATDIADRIGADVTATPVTAFSFGATNGTLGSPLNGSYGSLTLNADGSYTYTLDNTNPAVNALLNGQTLTETFSYTITDADGDTSTTTLNITIQGITDSKPEITPIDGNKTETGEATVFEKGLVAPKDGSQITTGTVSVNAPDGMASVTIGGTTFTVAQLATFSVGSPSAGINTGEGTLVVTGFNIVAGPNPAPTAGTLTYRYTLNAAQPHTGGNAVAESTDRITLVVTDSSSQANTATSTLIVRIVDDTPTGKADTNSVIEGTTTAATTTQGNVFGAIGASAGDVADRIGADATATPVTGVSFAGSVKTIGSAFNSAYGSLTLNANGSYIYTLDNTNPTVNALGLGQTLSETFSYTITDADGDTSTTTLTITINGRNDAPIAVNDIQAGITGQPVIINVLGNDRDPENNSNPATVRIVGTVNAGDSLEVAGEGIWSVNRLTGAITFTPFAGFTADPTPISYTVTDRTGLTSNPATVTVDYPQTPPLAVDNVVTAVTGKPMTITVLDNDSDRENDINPATIHIAGTANAGDSLVVAGQGTWSVDVSTGTITFTPNLGFTDSPTPISYTVSDNTGLMSNAARVTVNYPPVIVTDIGTSGSLIMLSNPDKTDSSSKYNEEEKKAILESKFKPDNQLPPARLSLYVPIRHHVISLTGSLRDQVVLELERYSFSVPRWMFRHTDPNEQLEFEAARPDGSSLPEWLTFNPKTLKFSGVPPKGAHDERVMVTARDTYGNEVHTTFNVHVNKERMRSGVHHKVLEKHKLGEKRAVGKASLSEQIHAMGKLNKLQESRALLDSFKSVVSLADE